MRKFSTVLLSIICLVCCCHGFAANIDGYAESTSANAEKQTVIKGTLLNNEKTKFTKVALQLAYGNPVAQYTEASISSDGSFELTATLPQTDVYRLTFAEKSNMLISLTPGDVITISLDANNLQALVKAEGSSSVVFLKDFVDVVTAKGNFLAEMNRQLRDDSEQKFYYAIAQKFDQYHQTNVNVDNGILKSFVAADSLRKLAQQCSSAGTLNSKMNNLFVSNAVPQLKAIYENFQPYLNYRENVASYYDFSMDRAPQYSQLYSLIDSYDDVLSIRHKGASSILEKYSEQARTLVSRYEELRDNGTLNSKKTLAAFAKEIFDYVNGNADKIAEQNALYGSNVSTGESLYKDVQNTAQQGASSVVKKYQDQYNAEERKRNDELIAMMREHKHDLAALVFLDTYFPKEKNVDFYSEIVSGLVETYPNHKLVNSYKEQLEVMKGTSAGVVAPDLAYPNPDGDIMKLSDLRGKVVLLDFWASWCRPCRNANPGVVAIYQKYKDKGFTVFSVSLDRDKNSWKNAIATDKLEWPNHVSDLKAWSSEAAAKYGVHSIPSTFLIDKEGHIVGKNLHGADLEKKILELLAK
ncbi:MAG: TlpA family protein disulfide reductase [Bacteroidales bacterium]|nr:TlpA family protein disulfide reductase [Bacteroidales bacterium]